MANLIRHGRIENANWPLCDEQQLSDFARSSAASASRALDAPVDGVIVPLPLWLTQRALCAALPLQVGVLIRDNDDLGTAAEHLPHIEVAAIEFSRFTNGRGYSIARLLRGRYGYGGELRAIGDILRDQIYYLSRVGFDAFELRADQDAAEALRALDDFSEAYQASSDRPVPLFRRRVA